MTPFGQGGAGGGVMFVLGTVLIADSSLVSNTASFVRIRRLGARALA